jgi:tetratricopeptide (TPR) repeat protein
MITVQQSKPYRELVQAVRSSDHTRQSQIIESNIVRAQGAEKAFWIRQRVARQMRTLVSPRDLGSAWPDLQDAYLAAPDDAENLTDVLSMALEVCIATEQFDQLTAFFRPFRSELPRLMHSHRFLGEVGLLHIKRRRWRQAYRAFSEAIEEFEKLPDDRRGVCETQLVFLYANRANVAVGCDRLDQAEADLTVAASIDRKFPFDHLNPLAQALAQGELAFARGRTQEARAALQRGIMRLAGARKRFWPNDQITFHVFAARLARAEGNMVSFHNFCDRALALAREHRLSLSEKAILAILDGADR